MKYLSRPHRLLVSGILAAAVIAAAPGAHAAEARQHDADVPEEIRVEDGNKVFLVSHAVGVQIYKCNATSSGFEWGFVAPRADLFNDKGKLIATHYAGPTWRAKDGSTAVGKRVDGVTVDQTAIPWLLLSVPSTSAGEDGDRLTHTTFIQRTETTGGVAPAAADCNSTTAGVVVEIPYTADYVFWKKARRHH